jgi:hypothetical protein
MDESTGAESKKSKYHAMYAMYEKNIDYWSVEHLIKTLQPKLLKVLTTYWWPKFCIRMSSFNDYVQQRYPLYYKLCVEKNVDVKKNFNDLNAENIERSLTYRMIQGKSAIRYALISDSTEKLLKKRKKVKIAESMLTYKEEKILQEAEAAKARAAAAANNGPDRLSYMKELTGYVMSGEYQTSPPVGWKRPPSRATRMFQMLIDNGSKQGRENAKSVAGQSGEAASKTPEKTVNDKEIYLEAIYNEEIGGQIFMKYLINRNKIVNYLKIIKS